MILFLFISILITFFIAVAMKVPLSFALTVILFYVLIYFLLSRREDKDKKIVVKVGNDSRRQDFIISEKDQSIFNQNSNPMLIVDSTYKITASNVSFNSFIGKNAKDLNLSLCLRSNELNDALSVALNNDKKSDISFMIYDQVHKYIQAQIFPIKIKKQNYALVMMIDETSQRVAEKVKSDFVSNVSHELKTPLTAITGFIETINGPAKNDEKQKEKFLKIIQNEAERMQRLVNDTLSLTRVEESEYQTPNEEVDLWICANSALDSVNHLSEKKQIKISFDGNYKDGQYCVKGNQDQITEVFENLLDNAITYSDTQTQIKIIFLVKETSVEFKVIDQGHGIAKEDIVRVSERFYRSKSANQYKKNSSGLGLAIVKHIINRHAGTLHIASEEGLGSTFTINLPRFSSNS
ncbi:MAG: ATP-binding protein [Gammaproteobacteria bacterium]